MFKGRSELGPRALGNRSILFNPNNSKAKDILGWIPKGDLPTWIEQYKKELGI